MANEKIKAMSVLRRRGKHTHKCGGASIETGGDHRYIVSRWVSCDSCGASSASTFKLVDAIDAWNRRKIVSSVPHVPSVPHNSSSLVKALKAIDDVIWNKKRHTREEVEAHRLATEALTNYNAEEGHQ